jgi:hypothetical protein
MSAWKALERLARDLDVHPQPFTVEILVPKHIMMELRNEALVRGIPGPEARSSRLLMYTPFGELVIGESRT